MLRISCALYWFFFTQLCRYVRSTKHRISYCVTDIVRIFFCDLRAEGRFKILGTPLFEENTYSSRIIRFLKHFNDYNI